MTTLTADDRIGISETLAMLGHITDTGQLERLEEVFTPDAVYDLSGVGLGALAGVETIRQGAQRMGAGNPVAHHLTNVVIIGEDDGEVSVQSKGLLLMADGKVESIRQHDILRRDHGGWRISRHTVTPQRSPLGGTLSAV